MATMKRLLCAFLLTLLNGSGAFVPPSQQLSQNAATTKSLSSIVIVQAEKDDDDKFSFGQKIESTKTAVVGLLAGGIALTPFALIHDVFLGGDFVRNGLAQWEFDTDMGSIEAALFAIVYRYCIREDDNPMLNQGVIGAFVLVRALSKIQVPAYCSAVPLNCGAPIGYFDWAMIGQGVFAGIESAALFGGTAFAIDYCFRKGFITKFP